MRGERPGKAGGGSAVDGISNPITKSTESFCDHEPSSKKELVDINRAGGEEDSGSRGLWSRVATKV